MQVYPCLPIRLRKFFSNMLISRWQGNKCSLDPSLGLKWSISNNMHSLNHSHHSVLWVKRVIIVDHRNQINHSHVLKDLLGCLEKCLPKNLNHHNSNNLYINNQDLWTLKQDLWIVNQDQWTLNQDLWTLTRPSLSNQIHNKTIPKLPNSSINKFLMLLCNHQELILSLLPYRLHHKT